MIRRLPRNAWLPLSCLAALVVLLLLVKTGAAQSVDEPVLHGADRVEVDALQDLARLFTDVVAPIPDVVVLLLVGLLLARREGSPRALLAAGVTAAAMTALVLLLKHVVDREGPARQASAGLAFPSGHTTAALVCYGAIAMLLVARRPEWAGRAAVAVAVLTVVVAACLVYNEYHWLLDTVGGIALGGVLLGLLRLDRLRTVLIEPPGRRRP